MEKSVLSLACSYIFPRSHGYFALLCFRVIVLMILIMMMMMMMPIVVSVFFFFISGSAGDSLRYHENKNFSTYFQDHNQQHPTNCPQHFLGAWWHDGCNPPQSNLNGGYFKNSSVFWLSLKGNRNSLKSTSMKIRSVTGERMHYSRAENNKTVDSGTNSPGFSSA